MPPGRPPTDPGGVRHLFVFVLCGCPCFKAFVFLLVFHFFEHLCWFAETFLQMSLLIKFSTFHRAHHGLLVPDFSDLAIDLLQVVTQLGGQLRSDLGEQLLVLSDLGL